jgi:hypothetical protein
MRRREFIAGLGGLPCGRWRRGRNKGNGCGVSACSCRVWWRIHRVGSAMLSSDKRLKNGVGAKATI